MLVISSCSIVHGLSGITSIAMSCVFTGLHTLSIAMAIAQIAAIAFFSTSLSYVDWSRVQLRVLRSSILFLISSMCRVSWMTLMTCVLLSGVLVSFVMASSSSLDFSKECQVFAFLVSVGLCLDVPASSMFPILEFPRAFCLLIRFTLWPLLEWMVNFEVL